MLTAWRAAAQICGRLPRVNFVEDVMERSPASRPGIVAIDAEGGRRDWAFGELIARSAGLSGAFAARGVRRGDVVMTLVGNRIEWALSLLACWRMGAVALPCSPQLRRHDMELRTSAAAPALCVVEEELLGEIPDEVPAMTLDEVAAILDEDRAQETPAAAEQMDAEDPALIVFTSGTTGEPRGVIHAYRYLTGQRAQAEHWLGSRPGELVWCTTAPGWSKSARNVFLAPWLTGAAAVIQDGRFDPAARLDLVEALGVNVLCQAPTEYRMLAARTVLRPLPALRRMVSAGEALGAETVAAFSESMGLAPADGYGQTETGHISGNLAGEPLVPGSMGRPLPGFEVRIEAGELQLRASSSPTFFSRYLDGERFEDEWWPTGDLVREEEMGTCSSRAATTTSSSPPATGSARSRSSRRCSPTLRSPRPPRWPRPTPSAARWCGRSSCRATASRARSWPASCRSTASARPPPTSSRGSSSSPPSCRRRRVARCAGRRCGDSPAPGA